MGIFDVLSGKIYQFNSLSGTLHDEFSERIIRLEDSLEKMVVVACFDITSEVIHQIFHPDKGMFKKRIGNLTTSSLRKVWSILMIYSASMILNKSEADPLLRTNVESVLFIVLGLEQVAINRELEHKIVITQLFEPTWTKLCVAVDENPHTTTGIEDAIRMEKFFIMYLEIFNQTMSKIRNL